MKNRSGNIVDKNGFALGAPTRSGALFLINGGKLSVKYNLVEILFTVPAVLPSVINVPLGNTVQGYLLTSFYWSIEAYSDAVLGAVPSGNTILPDANMAGSFITLQDNQGFAFWNPKPMRDLQTQNYTANTAGKSYVDSLGGMVINWQNSTISINKTTALTTGKTYSIPLGLAFTTYANYQEDGVGTSDPNIGNDVNN